MAILRKANAYSKKKVVPYTRVSKKRKKSYIRTVPNQNIVKFEMGKISEYHHDKFPYLLTLTSLEDVQIRHNALEACRQFLNKKLDKGLSGQYYLKVVPFPHHIQRENKMLTGAGSDRMQTGMQLSFGKSVGKSAILKKDAKLFIVGISNEKGIKLTRKIFKQIASKLPSKTRTSFSEIPRSNN